MTKFNAKNLAIIIFFGVLLVGIAGIANAQQVLPNGGDSFETAVKLESGSYEGGAMEKGELEYFYINAKPGQDIEIEGTFKALSDSMGEEYLTLYDEDRKKLTEIGATLEKGQQETFLFSWLPNADKDLHKYYIKRECTWVKIGALSFELSLTDRYDAGSQTDAGDSFEKAMSLTAGEYEGYLSGKSGADAKDFYEMEIKKGEELIVKVTPPMEASMEVALYDDSRKELRSEYAPNPGAIIETSLVARESEDIFVAVLCDEWCSYDLVNYTLDVTIQPSAEVVEAPVGEEGVPKVILPPGGVPTGEAGEAPKGILSGIGPWIAGSIVLLVIIGIAVSSFLKKKE